MNFSFSTKDNASSTPNKVGVILFVNCYVIHPCPSCFSASSKHADISQAKWGPGGVDRPSRSTYCPIHIAITYGHVVS